MIGNFADPGVYPTSSPEEPKLAREELMRSARDRAQGGGGRKEQTATELWEGAIRWATKGWLEGTSGYDPEAKLWLGGKLLEVNPAYRVGVRQGAKLRAVDGLRRSAADQAAATHTPTNLPPWDHIAHICELFGREGGQRPLAMAEADHADDFNRLPLKEGEQLTAVVTPQGTTGRALYGFIPRTQVFGSLASVLLCG